MNIAHDLKLLDEKFWRWEHNMMLSSERMAHNQMFWMGAAMAAMVLALIVFSIIAARNGGADPFSLPFQFNPYAR
jgi:hypothetical protein